MVRGDIKMSRKITDEQWKAIIENNKEYDDQFFYAVKTTKVFCRPSCKSRVPNYNNVTIFDRAEDALQAGYRPCKRCKPGGYHLPDEEWVWQIETFIKENYTTHLTLRVIAEGCHGSPFHLHRVFKNRKGMTPIEYLQRKRIEKAMKYLLETNWSIRRIGELIGLPNPSHFATLFKKYTKQTPREFRKRKRSEVLIDEHLLWNDKA